MNSLPLDQNLRPSLKPSLLSIAVRNSIVLLGMAHASVNAAEITVTSNLDDNGNGCTLREAINSANSSFDLSNGCAVGSDSGIDQINFDSTAFANVNTITLNNGQLLLAGKELEINAQSIGGVTISANSQSRVMQITGGDITLNSITVSDGRDLSEGAGILISNSAKVMLTQSEVSNNLLPFSENGSPEGAGINIQNSTLSLHNSEITRNTCLDNICSGGGIYALDNNVINITGSEISDNVISNVSSSRHNGMLVAGANNMITITNSRFSNPGGAAIRIDSDGSSEFDLIDSVIENNGADGDSSVVSIRLLDLRRVNIMRSRISDNSSAGTAAGLDIDNVESTQIIDSVISNNTGGGQLVAAGMELRNTDFVIHNTTISNNTLTTRFEDFAGGAGVLVQDIDYGLFNNVTMSDNNIEINNRSYGSSLAAIDNATLVMQNSIIANSEGAPTDCFLSSNSQLTIDSASIIEDGSCGATQSGDPGLLALADNGGPTPTHALSPNSIAINTGDTSTCLETDQRGAARDALCDVGAFEFGASVPNEIDDNAAELFVIPLPNGKTVIFSL